MSRRVLFLAERTSFPDGVVPPHGSGAHVAATLWGLRRNFEVLPLMAETSEGEPSSMRRLKRVVPARVRGLRQDLRIVREDRLFTRRALMEAAAFQPDIVYERNEYGVLAGVRVARSLGIPHVLEVNGLTDVDYREFYRSLGEPLGVVLEHWKLRQAQAVVAVTPGLGRAVSRRGARAERVVTIPNTVDPALMRVEPRPARRRDTVVVGWIGHVMSWHALDLLVKAADSITRQAPHVRFEIVGGGEGLGALERDVHDRGLGAYFRFTGPVPRTEIVGYLDRFDVGLLAGHFEFAFPVKLVEMGARGLAVAAPQTRSLDEMLRPGVEYEPFTVGDEVSLAAALSRLVLEPDTRAKRGAALQETVRTRYTWEASAEALRELVERLVTRPSPADPRPKAR